MKNLIVTASMIVCCFICIPRAEASGVAAHMITPADGSTLTASTVTFEWTTGTNVSKYWLWAGRARGGFELFDQDLGTTTRVTLGLPTDGSTVYVRLWSFIDGNAQYIDYSYTTANTGGGPTPTAQMIIPAPASTLKSSTVTFQWTGGTGVSDYRLEVGSATNVQLYYNQELTGLSATVANLPTDGTIVYVKLWSQISGSWFYNGYTYTAAMFHPGRSVPGDFDGDLKSDVTVFRPSDGTWISRQSSTGITTDVRWGGGSDVLVPGDYDGDGVIDIAVFRPSNGTWYIRYTSTPTDAALVWGGDGDVAVPADFDGDGLTDIAVFRPSTGTWYIRYTATSTSAALVWGGGGDLPVPADYDGDGKADIAVFRPSTGTWYIRYTGTPTSSPLVWGGMGDVPVPVDFDGDGKAEIAVFRPSNGTWYIRYTATTTSAALVWGGGGDLPVPGDFDGDGEAEIAVFRPSNNTWYIRYTGTPTSAAMVWGGAGDIPVLKRP